MEERRFTLSRAPNAPVATEELLADLNKVFEIVGRVISMEAYMTHGRFSASTITRRFGTWNEALKAAGFSGGNVLNFSDVALFENIMRLWEFYGHQPRRAALALAPSTISQSPYNLRFGSWTKALEQFVDFANANDALVPEESSSTMNKRGPRDPSLRLRFRVLKRDDFRCRACGVSPAITPGAHLHIDHILAWAAGGNTVEENLQTLCEGCNLGKSDAL